MIQNSSEERIGMVEQEQKVQKTKNYCYIQPHQIVLEVKTGLFAIPRGVATIQDVVFAEMGKFIQQQQNILETIEFECLYGISQLQKTPVLVLIESSKEVGNINKNTVYQVEKVRIIQLKQDTHEPFLIPFKLSFELFRIYYSKTYDLSLSLQIQIKDGLPPYHKFISNFIHSLQQPSIPPQLVTVCISGYLETKQLNVDGTKMQITIVSRANVNRIGRRWLRRGLDEKGNTANEYQTEVIWEIFSEEDHIICSHVQLRGSIPLFWRQIPKFQFKASIQTGKSQEQNRRHMVMHLQSHQTRYGNIDITLLNLVDKKGRQEVIGNAFHRCFNEIPIPLCRMIWFDYGTEYSRKGKEAFSDLINQIGEGLKKDSHFEIRSDENGNFKIIREQKEIVRTNCMDCLDRTNLVQSIISKSVCIQLQKEMLSFDQLYEDELSFKSKQIEQAFQQLWVNNGNAISLQYSGTHTMRNQIVLTGRQTIKGRLTDLLIGLKRFYLGHFNDYFYQNCIDLHFGKIDFQRDGQHFWGTNDKIFYRMLTFSGMVILPLILRKKIEQTITSSVKRYAALALSSFSGFLIGGIISGFIAKHLVQQPLSRKYEIY